MLLCHFEHGESFDIDYLDVVFNEDLVARVDFCFGEDLVTCKQLDILIADEIGQSIGSCAQVEQTAGICFFYPFFGIVVAVEDDALVCLDGAAHEFVERGIEIFGVFKLIGEFSEYISDDGVHDDVRL